jgi:hypothetical protein
MNHLEQLIWEWLEFKGYFVRRNVNVGRLSHGGHEGELDIVAYHPETKHVLHVEASTDAAKWDERKKRFYKKFSVGNKYILPQLFPWLPSSTRVEQWAVLWGSDKNHRTIGGGSVVPVSRLYALIAKDVREVKRGRAIPELFPLLRTMQFTIRWATPENTKQTENAIGRNARDA